MLIQKNGLFLRKKGYEFYFNEKYFWIEKDKKDVTKLIPNYFGHLYYFIEGNIITFIINDIDAHKNDYYKFDLQTGKIKKIELTKIIDYWRSF